MPILFGFEVVSASYDRATRQITVAHVQGGANQYPSCQVRVTKDGGSTWYTAVIDTWSDTQSTATFATPLPSGLFTVEETSADNAVDELASAFMVLANAKSSYSYAYGYRY